MKASPAPRLTSRGARTRERIVTATAELAFEQGMAQTRLEDIQAAAGVSASQIYHYFSGKQQLLQAVIAQRESRVVGRHESMLEQVDSIEGLHAWADMIVEHQRLTHCRGGCPLGTLANETAESDPDARTQLAGSFERWTAALRRALHAMQVTGHLRPEASPDDLALSLLAALQGGLLLAKVQRSTRPLRVALDGILDLVARQAVPAPH